MRLLKDYQELENQIHAYFGYVEGWKVIPLDDSTEYYWKLREYEGGSGRVCYGEQFDDVNEETGSHYDDEIYTQRFLPKYVYRGQDYTMISCDTHVDGNKFLRIFDNKLEVI